MYKETFGQKLKKARIDAQFTQEKVEQETGIKRETLSKYERGKIEPSIEIIGVLCDLYFVSADWLIGTKGANL